MEKEDVSWSMKKQNKRTKLGFYECVFEVAMHPAKEQNYNMVDNVLNNGAGEKAQKKVAKREQEQPVTRISLKARLAEKKAQVAGQNQDHDVQVKPGIERV